MKIIAAAASARRELAGALARPLEPAWGISGRLLRSRPRQDFQEILKTPRLLSVTAVQQAAAEAEESGHSASQDRDSGLGPAEVAGARTVKPPEQRPFLDIAPGGR